MSRVLVIAGRLERHPWTPGRFAQDLIGSLTSRGHRVTVLCDGVEDPAALACERVHAMRPYEHNMASRPLAFRRWASRIARGLARDAEISLTRLVPAPLWMPIEPSARAFLRDGLACRGFASAGMWLTRHHASVLGVRLERAAAHPRTRSARPIRILTFGPAAADAARRTLGTSDVEVIDVGIASGTPLLTDEQRERLRTRTRRLLGLKPDRHAVLLSCMASAGARLEPFLEGVKRCAESGATRDAVVLAAARDPYALHDAACRVGCQSAMRIVGQTERMDAMLAACDAAVLPLAAEPDAFSAGATGRFLAAAMRAGRPVIAARGAPGTDVPALHDDGSPALLLDTPDADAWAGGLERVADEDWVNRASAAAVQIGESMGFGRLVDRVESAMSVAELTRRDLTAAAV